MPSDLDYGVPRVKAFDPTTAAEAQRDAMEVLDKARLAIVGIWGSKNKNFLPHKPGLLQL